MAIVFPRPVPVARKWSGTQNVTNQPPVLRVSFAFQAPSWCGEFIAGDPETDLPARIDGMCSVIESLWCAEANRDGDPNAGLEANDRLRERVYFMMYWLREVGLMDEARTHMRRSGRRGRRPKSDAASTFVDVLHHVFRDDFGNDLGSVSSKSRPRIARELAYALQHDIPPVLLLPFLRHATQAEILRRQKLGIVEEWLPTGS